MPAPFFKKPLGYFIFEYARKKNPTSLAVQNWDKVYSTSTDADTTWGGITAMAGASLTQYGLEEVQNLMATNELDFEKLLKPKSALFILYDDSNSTKNFISNNLYAQLFSYLYNKSLEYDDQKLPEKIRFFLDDFKNITIPNFADYLATARSRNLSICMMVQDESQLRAKYGMESPSIIGNCSAYLLTGTIDLQMAKDASERFNLSPLEIRTMPEENFLVDISGYVTKTERFDYHNHPNYVDEKTNINSLYTTPNIIDSMDWKILAHFLINAPDVKKDRDPYWKIAQDMQNNILTISNTDLSSDERFEAIDILKAELDQCIQDENLNDLTKIYRNTEPTTDINVGYDQNAVSDFVTAMLRQYPKPLDED